MPYDHVTHVTVCGSFVAQCMCVCVLYLLNRSRGRDLFLTTSSHSLSSSAYEGDSTGVAAGRQCINIPRHFIAVER